MRSFFYLAALPLLVSAWSENTLLGRQTGNATECASSDKVCGAFCIPSTYTCCPDLEGGCAVDTVCQKGDNDVYGCCPTGETCTGDGGAEFIDSDSSSSSGSGSGSGSSGSNGSGSGSSSNGAGALVLNTGAVVAVAAAGVFFGL